MQLHTDGLACIQEISSKCIDSMNLELILIENQIIGNGARKWRNFICMAQYLTMIQQPNARIWGIH